MFLPGSVTMLAFTQCDVEVDPVFLWGMIVLAVVFQFGVSTEFPPGCRSRLGALSGRCIVSRILEDTMLATCRRNGNKSLFVHSL